ncbi:MAG: AAA family ATPase, partial [Deltaproteobacteria bacterium]|nr:AAA family ATPase [Deltaproteobacteria bacterium]
MGAQLKTLPIGLQTFEEIIGRGSQYVDKTAYLAKMIGGEAEVRFLSRPRRFGKSLTVTTLAAFFSGQKEFFQGLAIEKHWGE